MKLTGTKVAEAKPTARERKLSDGGGLYLLVKPNGTKAWRYKYRFNGKELTLAIGLFPEISLKQAQGIRDMPVIRDHPDWWAVLIVDRFGSHCKTLKPMLV